MAPSNPVRQIPYPSAVAVVPDDAGAIAPTKALYIGGGGNLRVLTVSGEDVILVGVAGSGVYGLSVTRVWATNTTATDIVALR